MAEVAGSLSRPAALPQTLAEVTHAARDTIPAVTSASITARDRDGQLTTLVSTDELALSLDATQYELRSGPCVDAFLLDPPVQVAQLPDERRWPDYSKRATELGIRSQLGYRLETAHGALGALNLYSPQPYAFDEEAEQLAGLFAAQAAIALGVARRDEQLNQALASRKVIGQALGILMERYSLDESKAFRFLVRVSRTGNIKLREVAEELVEQVNTQARSKG